MSFAGHVFDMIRRNKEYRDQSDLRRERMHSVRDAHKGRGIPNVTAEEFDRIDLLLKKREMQQSRYIFRMTWLYLGGVIGVTALIALIVFWCI